jgi:hypothetical protein
VEVRVPKLIVLEELPDDEQRPALTHDVERMGERAVLVVALHNLRSYSELFQNGSLNLQKER